MSKHGKALDDLIAIMDRLLSPGGCPWDREQTHESLVRYLIEESYEVIETIKDNEMNKLKEELGDLLLQIVFHAALAEREGYFAFADIAEFVSKKMQNRHPHVFGEMQLETSDDVMANWEKFKKKEGKKYILEGIPKSLPALMRAEKLQEKARGVGFDWPDVQGAVDKVREEIEELAFATNNEEMKEEMGDVFFAMVNVARMRGIEPEQALQACNDKFSRRFNYIEEKIKQSGREFEDLSLEEMDELWNEAKQKGM